MTPGVKSQVERIMDETHGAYTDVIVQFRSERDKSLSKLLEVAVATERNRAMLVDPSLILPPDSSAFDGSRSARRKLRGQEASLVANMALQSLSLSALSGPSLTDLAMQFLSSDQVQSAINGAKKRLRTKSKLADPHMLHSISGARIMIARNDLPQIIEDNSAAIEGVYENVHIKAPRVSEASASAEASSHMYRGTTWGLEYTKALSAWSAFSTRGRRPDGTPVRIAVLDTGIDATHPDLVGKVADYAEFDASGNKVKDGVANARDSGQHGTHVAGTIVGGNASGGWIGMAPEAEVVAGLVLDGDAGGTLAQVIAGIEWAVASGAHVINLSLGGLTFDSSVGTPYQRAIVDALAHGSLVVAAIGNDGHQTSGAPGNDYFSLAVAAHDNQGRCAGFSAGRTHVLNQSNFIDSKFLPLVYTKPDVSAPGVAVKSCVPGGDWASFNGTSMATPHVSGAAALLFAATDLATAAPENRAFVARDLLLGGVTDLGEAGQDQRFGYGTINVLRSIDEALRRGF